MVENDCISIKCFGLSDPYEELRKIEIQKQDLLAVIINALEKR